MKNFVCLVSMSVFTSAIAFAFPTAEQMNENFKICEASSPKWDSKWGKYVVTFDRNEAQALCNQMYSGRGIPKLAACRANGQSLYAGYVCDELDGGGHR